MKLKVAEYDLQTGKFLKFLELGKDFGYFGDSILLEIIYNTNLDWNPISLEGDLFEKDERDPLNRFNGLFDGRTYDEGRFILVEGNNDSIIKAKEEYYNFFLIYEDDKYVLDGNSLMHDNSWGHWNYKDIIGNLHENPELWDKIK